MGGFNRKYMVTQPGLNGESELILDSGRAKSNKDSIVVELPSIEVRPYRIVLPEKGLDFYFINDTKEVEVFFNTQLRTWRFNNSPASNVWQDFQGRQTALVEQQHRLRAYIDSLTLTHGSTTAIDSANQQIFRLVQQGRVNNTALADTTTSSGIFLLANSGVSFGHNYKEEEAYLKNVQKRFPHHQIIQRIVDSALEHIRIFGNPFHIGDILPDLTLPDQNGTDFSIYSIKNRYILINFWSTLCFQCKPFLDSERQALKSNDQLALVSVVLDNQKDQWHNIIQNEGYNWTHLMDEKMWGGSAAKTLRFESIPFNYLIGPDRRILAKGIPADSLQETLSRFIKH